MRSTVRRVLRSVRNASGAFSWSTRSFAQEGEDLVVKRMFDGTQRGFYVDVGCHHPFRFSNTYLFYRQGWRGICVDPLPGVANLFGRWRPRDIAIEAGIAGIPSVLTYHMFDEPALNTFDATVAASIAAKGVYRVIETRQVQARPLADVLAEHLPGDVRQIDLFSIDVEGLDLEVLRSNDWNRFAPRAIIAECLNATLLNLGSYPVVEFLGAMGYRPHAKTGHSVVFSRESPPA